MNTTTRRNTMSLTTFASLPTEAELKSYQIVATIASNNPHWKKLGGNGKPEEIIATILSVMLLARELGFSPMQAVSGGINNIQGKFEISARLMNQAIRARGHKMKVKIMTEEICVIWGQRRDTHEEMEVDYHIDEARRSGLVKEGGAWKKVPKDMLFARCISRLARRLYPDCIGGCYVEGELQETILGAKVETIEIPKQDEIEFILPAPIELNLPSDISADRIDAFVVETATQTKRNVEDVKKRAVGNMDGFLQVFREWEEKKYPLPVKIEDTCTVNIEPVYVVA
jgi:hypothetical protein